LARVAISKLADGVKSTFMGLERFIIEQRRMTSMEKWDENETNGVVRRTDLRRGDE
jgi:hypothetical protein